MEEYEVVTNWKSKTDETVGGQNTWSKLKYEDLAGLVKCLVTRYKAHTFAIYINGLLAVDSSSPSKRMNF